MKLQWTSWIGGRGAARSPTSTAPRRRARRPTRRARAPRATTRCGSSTWRGAYAPRARVRQMRAPAGSGARRGSGRARRRGAASLGVRPRRDVAPGAGTRRRCGKQFAMPSTRGHASAPIRLLLVGRTTRTTRCCCVGCSDFGLDGALRHHAGGAARGGPRAARGRAVRRRVLSTCRCPTAAGSSQTFSRVDSAAPAVPVVVLSGLTDEAVSVSAVQKGAQRTTS